MSPVELYSKLARSRAGNWKCPLPKAPTEMLVFALEEREHAVVVRLPIRTQSESNTREHWRQKANRVRDQRRSVRMALAGYVPKGDMYCVILTRFAPRELDEFDNLPRSFKAIVDEVAAQIGLDDRDARIKWQCAQEKSRAYGVQITIGASNE